MVGGTEAYTHKKDAFIWCSSQHMYALFSLSCCLLDCSFHPNLPAHHFKSILSDVDPVLQVTLFMVVTCQVLLGVGRRGCGFILNMIGYIIQLTLLRMGSVLSQRDTKLLSDIPVDIRTAEKHFSLQNQHTIYAVCPNPACHYTYKPQFTPDSPVPIYPSQCTHREFPNDPVCGTHLLKSHSIAGHTVSLPIKSFVAYSFKDWLGGLVSRSDFEEKMDASWNRAEQTGDMHDIFDGGMLRDFKGPDGKHFSCGGENSEGRYAFSLCVDFFNPLGNKQAGKKKSVGLISLVCLNLPPDLRYKAENMFLFGVVPGPAEPPLDCLNHYLTHLVDELLELWHEGVRFSRTYRSYYGRVARCALACVVSDLPAARKINGFAGIGHTQVCAMCHCVRVKKDNGDSYICLCDRRTKEEYEQLTKLYCDSVDADARKKTAQKTGVRWSVLHRLPYFDPSRFVVVDAMHNLFLGLIQEHFELLGIRLNDKEKDPAAIVLDIPQEVYNSPQVTSGGRNAPRRTLRLLESPITDILETSSGMNRLTKRITRTSTVPGLQLICNLLRIEVKDYLPPTTYTRSKYPKKDYIAAILAWVRVDAVFSGFTIILTKSHQRSEQTEIPSPLRKGSFLTQKDVDEIRADIECMSTPSWLTSVPRNLGEASHGKLKSDQWRTLGTTYLPISLIRMWSPLDDDSERSAQCKKLLSATLSLVSAVTIASSRTTSYDKADQYLRHMQNYLREIRGFFLRTNFDLTITWRSILRNICDYMGQFIHGGPFRSNA